MTTKLYISADLEGANGVISPLQCTPDKDPAAYELAVAQLALEVNTVAEAALAGGADFILVNDSHCAMTNLAIAQLDSRVALLSGKPKLCAMAAGLDTTFDGAIYIGYHAKAGSEKGILNHTFHSKLFDVSVNGVSYGEGGINALYASLVHGVPVVLASGDQTFCAEIRELIPQLETVQTKITLTTTAAHCRPQVELLEDYRAKTYQVLRSKTDWKRNLLSLSVPYDLTVTFTHSLDADVAMTLPWIKRLDGRTVTYQAKDFQEVYQALQSIYSILSYTHFME